MKAWHDWYDAILLVIVVLLGIAAGKWWHDLPVAEKQKQDQTMVTETDIMLQCTIVERMYLDALALVYEDEVAPEIAQVTLVMNTTKYLAQDYPVSRLNIPALDHHAKWALEYARTTKPSQVQSLLQAGVNNKKIVACMNLHAMSANKGTYWSGLHPIIKTGVDK